MNISGLVLFLTFIIGSQACPRCPDKITEKHSKDLHSLELDLGLSLTIWFTFLFWSLHEVVTFDNEDIHMSAACSASSALNTIAR